MTSLHSQPPTALLLISAPIHITQGKIYKGIQSSSREASRGPKVPTIGIDCSLWRPGHKGLQGIQGHCSRCHATGTPEILTRGLLDLEANLGYSMCSKAAWAKMWDLVSKTSMKKEKKNKKGWNKIVKNKILEANDYHTKQSNTSFIEGREILNVYIMYAPFPRSISPPGDGEGDISRRSLSSTNEQICIYGKWETKVWKASGIKQAMIWSSGDFLASRKTL